MTDETIGTDELRITIEAGDDYHASPRLAAALEELATALEESETDDEVSGFGMAEFKPGFSLFYVSPAKVGYTENDSKGKKKGNVEYSWKIEEGEAWR